MKSRLALGLVILAAASLALTGCNGAAEAPPSPTPTAEPTTPSGNDPSDTASPAAVSAGLAASETALGTIVTASDGKVVYMYGEDTQGSGESACPGQCLANWPAVPGGADAPTVTGITGEVTTIIGTDGQPQLTLNGWPLYYYVGDNNPGDANGQGVGDVWFVLTPAGEPVKD